MTVSTTPRLIQMHPNDNVAIVANDHGLPEGTVVPDGPTLVQRIPQAHKVALCDINARQDVRRYNVIIGYARQDLPAGTWINEHLLDMPPAAGFQGLPVCTNLPAPQPALEGYTFQGYRNADGSAGTRNLLAVSSTVQCVSGVIEQAVRRIRAELLPRFPNVDGVVALEHIYGCGVAINVPEAEIPIRTIRNIAKNPNFGGRGLVVSLGCEKLQPDVLFPEGYAANIDLVQLQDPAHIGFEAMIQSILTSAELHLEQLNTRKRETCPASDLVVGMQCGGSDAFSGVTANPALGKASDLIVQAGGTVMFSENTEVRDGIAQLTARAATPDVAQDLIRELKWYDDYLARWDTDRSANTTPGNKAGGLSNIVEKAMGSIIKSGSSAISGVVPPGEQARQKGLLYAATPAGDFVCGTLQLAAGATLHVFTTGRGTPYSLEAMPVIKVSTRSELKQRWHDLIDLDAGPVALGEATLDDMGLAVFELILKTASGDKTAAERLGLVNSLALFNPGPVT